jgi:hypothetical protein
MDSARGRHRARQKQEYKNQTRIDAKNLSTFGENAAKDQARKEAVSFGLWF